MAVLIEAISQVKMLSVTAQHPPSLSSGGHSLNFTAASHGGPVWSRTFTFSSFTSLADLQIIPVFPYGVQLYQFYVIWWQQQWKQHANTAYIINGGFQKSVQTFYYKASLSTCSGIKFKTSKNVNLFTTNKIQSGAYKQVYLTSSAQCKAVISILG